MPEFVDDSVPPFRTWRPMALWTAGILLAGLMASALSLLHHSVDFCTATSRGWPFGIIIHPCLCWGFGEVDWIISYAGLLGDVATYALIIAALGFPAIGLLRKKAAGPCAASRRGTE